MPVPRHLHPKVKWVWFLPTVVLLLVVWLVASLFVLVSPDAPILGLGRGAFIPLFLAFLLVFIGGPVYAYYHIEYMSFTYELGETEFIIRQGVFTRDTTVIPYNRIQNINTRRTLLERMLGLASLQIETAGTNPNASEGVLPGVSRKDELVHEIMTRVEAAKSPDGMGGGGGADTSRKTEHQLLSEILKELGQLNKNLEKKNGKGEEAPKTDAKWPHLPPAPPSLSGRPDHKR